MVDLVNMKFDVISKGTDNTSRQKKIKAIFFKDVGVENFLYFFKIFQIFLNPFKHF